MKKLIVLILIFTTYSSFGQIEDYSFELEAITINELAGLQSYSVAQHNGEWLIVGGRLDGLHKRQPFASFDAAGNNNQIWVVNPATDSVWKAPLSTLSMALQEQLASTNHNFFQDGDNLIVTGGYGYSATAGDHVTYNGLVQIEVSNAISAIKSGSNLSSYIHQITDSLFDVTGGRLDKIGNTFYLVGGQKFEGRYNPQDPTHGPGYLQEYTDQIRKFTVAYNPLSFSHAGVVSDTNLHRRDYNVLPQIMPNGDEGLTAFSGVFQRHVDLPYLNSVDITSSSISVNNSFSQYYNHYHCASLPIYDATANEMHSYFFGGIARYFDNNGVLTMDNDVPFVKTIARVTRASNGAMSETKLEEEMPALLGAGSEFIVNKSLAAYDNHVLKWDSIQGDSIFLGYIFGGIESTAPNVFFSNQDNVSSATNTIYKVTFVKNQSSSIHESTKKSKSYQLQVFPNPTASKISVQFYLDTKSDVEISLTNHLGQVQQAFNFNDVPSALNVKTLELNTELTSGIYFVNLKVENQTQTLKIFIQ